MDTNPAPATHEGQKISVAQRLGAFVAKAAKDHPPEAVNRAQAGLLDTLGCMLLGAGHEDTRKVLDTVADWSNGTVPVIGTDIGLAPPYAALVNATSAHSLDLDDWDEPGVTHTSAILIPAILAVAGDDTKAADILDAHIIGVEAIIRIGEAVNMHHYRKGWHATNTIGAIGAAAAVARLMRLDAGQCANALSLATSMAGGYTIQFGYTAKPLHAGLAAQSGVLAVSLAANGATGNLTAIENVRGFAGLLCDVGPEAFDEPMAKLGNPLAILEYGLHKKMYPSCGGTHLAIEAAEKLHARFDLPPDRIRAVEIVSSQLMIDILPYGVPQNRTEALFSLPWCTAFGLVTGHVGINAFGADALLRNDVRDLAARVRISSHPRNGDDIYHKDFPDIVRITLTDGTTYEEQAAFPRGSPQRPASLSELVSKFLECARYSIPAAQAKEVCERVLSNPADWSLGQLLPVMKP